MKIKYYLISGVDRTRDQFMIDQFNKAKIDQEDVVWIKKPNKNDLTPELIKQIFKKTNHNLKLGQISCTYKHYLALKNIVDNEIDLAVIMEDNIEFRTQNFPERLNKYIEQLPPDWDILFEGDTLKYIEQRRKKELLVYKKYNKVTRQCAGGTNAANCYILSLKTAKQFYDNFLPFYNVIDHYMNDLLRKYNINSYWAVPPVVHRIRRKSTALSD